MHLWYDSTFQFGFGVVSFVRLKKMFLIINRKPFDQQFKFSKSRSEIGSKKISREICRSVVKQCHTGSDSLIKFPIFKGKRIASSQI